jgi:hypothetical protein
MRYEMRKPLKRLKCAEWEMYTGLKAGVNDNRAGARCQTPVAAIR